MAHTYTSEERRQHQQPGRRPVKPERDPDDDYRRRERRAPGRDRDARIEPPARHQPAVEPDQDDDRHPPQPADDTPGSPRRRDR